MSAPRRDAIARTVAALEQVRAQLAVEFGERVAGAIWAQAVRRAREGSLPLPDAIEAEAIAERERRTEVEEVVRRSLGIEPGGAEAAEMKRVGRRTRRRARRRRSRRRRR